MIALYLAFCYNLDEVRHMASDKIYTIDEIKEISKPILAKFDFVDKVYLFGSYARNEQTKDSDLDIVIELVDEDDVSQMSEFYYLSPRLESAFNKKS